MLGSDRRRVAKQPCSKLIDCTEAPPVMNQFATRPQLGPVEVGPSTSQNPVAAPIPELTELQLKCLEGFWNRRSAKQIAGDLGISEAWVNKNLLGARRKLHVNSSADAATIVFGAKPASIKTYYYQETGVSGEAPAADHSGASAIASPIVGAASERPLINRYQPLTILGGIILVAFVSIIAVSLMVDAGQGLYQLWKAFGY